MAYSFLQGTQRTMQRRITLIALCVSLVADSPCPRPCSKCNLELYPSSYSWSPSFVSTRPYLLCSLQRELGLLRSLQQKPPSLQRKVVVPVFPATFGHFSSGTGEDISAPGAFGTGEGSVISDLAYICPRRRTLEHCPHSN